MICDRNQINSFVKAIRAGKPPKLPEGRSEEFYILDDALGSFGSFGIREWMGATAIGTAWALQTKRNGRQQKKHIGAVHVLDLDQALKAAKDLAAKMQLGLLDPIEAKKKAMQIAKVTFQSMVPLFLKAGDLRPSTLKAWTAQLTGYYLRPLHKLPLDEITPAQISTQIDRILYGADGRKASPAVAWQVYWVLNRFFVWAYETSKVARDFVNPMGQVKEPPKGVARDRNLEDDEIRLIWRACEEWEAEVLADDAREAASGQRGRAGQRSSTDFPRAVRLLFLTGCRPQEIGDLKWSYLDLEAGEVCFPAEVYKTGKKVTGDIIFPLSDQAIEILRRCEGSRQKGRDYVFGRKGNKAGVDLDNVHRKINRRIAKMGAPIEPAVEQRVRDMLADGIPTYRIRKEAHVSWSRIGRIKSRMDAGTPVGEAPKPLAPWQTRDIRRTFSTKCHGIGIPFDDVERLMGHIVGKKIARGYNKHEYWPEKRAAIARWDAHLASIIGGTAEKVVRPTFGQRSAS
jgi:integrase